MKLETIKLIDKMLREAVTKAQHEVESKKKEAETALMASFEMRNKEDANRQWIYSNEMEKEQGKAKEWYDEVWKAQRDFANSDWR